MLGFLKALPFMAVVLLMAYGAHTFIVGGLNKQVDKLQQQVEMYVAQNVALQTAADMNESTIRSLEEGAKRQIEQIGNLQDQFNIATAQKNEALRIFILSISAGETIPIAQVIASSSIIGRKRFLFFSESILLSFSIIFLNPLGRITAAATTGPAKQPLPASSQPAIILAEGK